MECCGVNFKSESHSFVTSYYDILITLKMACDGKEKYKIYYYCQYKIEK
jgi:hypothetical protein